ncbi:MAG: hypothetical protein FJW40_05750 [Acidobacteria bacterium]|nr:hypothetical protein [Acidobacteriota bacterium]
MTRRLLALTLLAVASATAQRTYTVRMAQGVVRMPAEELTVAALAGEHGAFQRDASLRAMAVAIRTFARAHSGRHAREGFDFCNTTHCQVLRPQRITSRHRRAALATAHEILWWRGKPALAYYHRHCGGMTESAAKVWPGTVAPYLAEKADSYCGREAWSAELPGRTVEVVERSPGGHVRWMLDDGQRMTGDAFRYLIGRESGLNLIRSTRFTMRTEPGRLIFEGNGSGHGVGLCQVGAEKRARAGHDYRTILAAYFPGTTLGVTSEGLAWQRLETARLEVWTTRPALDQVLIGQAEKLLPEAERRAGVPFVARPGLRLYPTAASFEASQGTTGLHLAPRESFTAPLALESAVLRELLRGVVESNAHPETPQWFRDGVVNYLVDPRTVPGMVTLSRRFGRKRVLSWVKLGLPSEAYAGNPAGQSHPGRNTHQQRQ